jgi:hypothetical protein
LLSDEATPQAKGSVFDFHRSTDTLRAVLGPLSALAFLAYCLAIIKRFSFSHSFRTC